MYKYRWYCRWCGITYDPAKRTDRDGFCTTKHKQAHHRAYNKYVTAKRGSLPANHDRRTAVTQNKRKKSK